MAQPSMPFGVFRGRQLDEWNWYFVDPRVARLDPNLESWVRHVTPLADVWDINREVAGAVALEELRLQSSDPRLEPGIHESIDERHAEQLLRVREVGARVGYELPAGGLAIDED